MIGSPCDNAADGVDGELMHGGAEATGLPIRAGAKVGSR
jgi:hypothetical protein